jgi:hypothetical protein
MIIPRFSHVIALVSAGLCLHGTSVQSSSLDKVDPVDLETLSADVFSLEELDIPWHHGPTEPMSYYLKHFHRLANAVVEEGENKGFIDLKVWRHARDVAPHNARIMENLLSFAWFYCKEFDWNPYYNDPALRARFELALRFWLNSQSSDGRFSEYGPSRWHPAGTGFATKFMAETLEVIDQSDAELDAELVEQLWDAQYRAIMAMLEREDIYVHGSRFSNQMGTVWAPALMYLSMRPDAALESQLRLRLESAKVDMQSPAGFFYELHGPDWGYAFGTHVSNISHAWRYAQGTDWEEYFVDEMERWGEWLAYNAYPEPGNDIFTLNCAIQSRQNVRFLHRFETPLAEVIPLFRVWSPTQAEVQRRQESIREKVAETWPHQSDLNIGGFGSYSPYAFIHRSEAFWHPSDKERLAAFDLLPSHQETSFAHQRVDSRNPLVYTYIKRPGYYLAFNSGSHIRPLSRLGIGLMANPETGAFLQSHDRTDRFFWGARAEGAEIAYEAGDLDATFLSESGASYPIEVGNHHLPEDFKRIRYALGEAGTKELAFFDDHIVIAIEHPGAFTEQIPLLISGEPIASSESTVVFEMNGRRIEVRIEAGQGAMTLSSSSMDAERTSRHISYLEDFDWLDLSNPVGSKGHRLLEIKAENTLTYSIHID